MTRRRSRRKNLRSSSNNKVKSQATSNLFLNSSIGVLAILILALSYSWIHRQFIAISDDQRALIPLSNNTTTLTSKMWMEKRFRDVKVEVLNGIGIDGIAAIATDYLRDQGFDVVKTDNADHSDYTFSLIKDRAGNLRSARSIAEVLNIDTLSVLQDINKSLILDVTVILGRDYQNLSPFSTAQNLP